MFLPKKRKLLSLEEIAYIPDIIWKFLLFVPSLECFILRRVCKLWENIIESQVFQKERFEDFSKKKEKYKIIKKNIDLISWNEIDLDGCFSSEYYRLKEKPQKTNYYLLNFLHTMLKKLNVGFNEGDNFFNSFCSFTYFSHALPPNSLYLITLSQND